MGYGPYMSVHATLNSYIRKYPGVHGSLIGNPELLQFTALYEYGHATLHQLHTYVQVVTSIRAMFIFNSKRRKYPVDMRFRTRVYGPGILLLPSKRPTRI